MISLCFLSALKISNLFTILFDSIDTRVRAALLVVTPVIVGPNNEAVGETQPVIKNNEIIITIFFNIKDNDELHDSLQKDKNKKKKLHPEIVFNYLLS